MSHFLLAAPSLVAYKRSYRFKVPDSRLLFLFFPPKSKGNSASGALLEARRIPGSSDGNTRPATAQVQDTTALEIAASDALFGQTGADESWAWGDAAAATSAPTATDFLARGNHNPRKTGGIRNATGGADSMGNYDRHHRGAQVAGMSHQLPRMKTSGNASNGAPYLHQFLERNSANNSTNPQLFNATNSFGDASMSTNMTGKRPRPGNSSSFLTPSFGFPSPPPLETDHPLPDFNNWGFGGRNVTRMSSGATISSSSAMPAASHGNSISTANLSAIGSGLSSPNGASMFAGVDSFLPDYDASLYSLWTASSGDYETENDTAQNQHQQVQPPLYMTSDDELKMDYPQLTEFNQDLDSYLNDTMESGGPSPTTPLGTSGMSSMVKMDHLVVTDRRTSSGIGAEFGSSMLTPGNREPPLDRLLVPAAATATAEYLVKQDRETAGSEITSERSLKRSRGGYDDAYGVVPISSGMLARSTPRSTFRSVPKNAVIEPKRTIPPLGSFHSGPPPPLMLTSAASRQAGIASSGNPTTTAIVTSPTTTFDAAKTGKRPRSRQCEFPGCQNRARSHQKCKKHGGAHQCVFEGCTKNSQSRGLCIAHGGGSRCKREGCVRAAQSKGLCKSHGGGEFCAVEGCNKKAHLKHLCRTHGGGVRCKVDKCLKWAQRKGWCMAHAKEFAAT